MYSCLKHRANETMNHDFQMQAPCTPQEPLQQWEWGPSQGCTKVETSRHGAWGTRIISFCCILQLFRNKLGCVSVRTCVTFWRVRETSDENDLSLTYQEIRSTHYFLFIALDTYVSKIYLGMTPDFFDRGRRPSYSFC